MSHPFVFQCIKQGRREGGQKSPRAPLFLEFNQEGNKKNENQNPLGYFLPRFTSPTPSLEVLFCLHACKIIHGCFKLPIPFNILSWPYNIGLHATIMIYPGFYKQVYLVIHLSDNFVYKNMSTHFSHIKNTCLSFFPQYFCL